MIPNLRQLVLWKFCESEKEGCHTVTPQVTTCVTWLIRNSTFQREFMLWCSCESDSRVVTELWRTMTGSSGPTYPGIIPYHTGGLLLLSLLLLLLSTNPGIIPYHSDPPSPSCPPRLIGAQHSSIDHHHHNHHIITTIITSSSHHHRNHHNHHHMQALNIVQKAPLAPMDLQALRWLQDILCYLHWMNNERTISNIAIKTKAQCPQCQNQLFQSKSKV